MKLNDYITIKEAAEYLGVTPITLRRWDEAGRFVAKRHPVSNYRLYSKRDLEKLLKDVK